MGRRRALRLLAHILVICTAAVQAQQTPPASPEPKDALPGCPTHCGGVQISYPFGIGKNCSVPDFEIECSSRDIPYLLVADHDTKYEVLDISVKNATVRITDSFSPTCNSSYNYWTLWTPWPNFKLSPRANVFTVIGCNVLGRLREYPVMTRTVGCISICPPPDTRQNSTLVLTGACDGVGCCEMSAGVSAGDYEFSVKKIDSAEISNVSDIKECYRTFFVEKGRYNFTGIGERVDPKVKVTQPLLVDWSIASLTCEEGMSNRSTYACKDQNSNCTYANGFGYRCSCKPGYEGNPYLDGGCQDIDECKTDNICAQLDMICVNKIGSYSCYAQGLLDSKSHSNVLAIALGTTLGGLFLCVATVLCFLTWRKQRRRQERRRHLWNNNELLRRQLLQSSAAGQAIAEKIKFFTLKDLMKATNGFDDSYAVGRGGHGVVYKGLIDLQVVAIKKSQENTPAEIQGFVNEIILLSQVSHRNIVRLAGCCFEAEVPLLVYEFISNGTLADHLHQRGAGIMPWEDRLRIAGEISCSLSYLHSAANISIFHRDIKSANVLLDEKLTAKISDFGASRFVGTDHTHVSGTNVQGTFGYLDPEYWQTGRLTEKTDVYSLGVMLVELLTGERPTSMARAHEEGNVISHFIAMVKQNRVADVLDRSLLQEAAEGEEAEMEAVARLAASCLRITGVERPTMKEVEVILVGIRKKKQEKVGRSQSGDKLEEEGGGSFADFSLDSDATTQTLDWTGGSRSDF